MVSSTDVQVLRTKAAEIQANLVIKRAQVQALAKLGRLSDSVLGEVEILMTLLETLLEELSGTVATRH